MNEFLWCRTLRRFELNANLTALVLYSCRNKAVNVMLRLLLMFSYLSFSILSLAFSISNWHKTQIQLVEDSRDS